MPENTFYHVYPRYTAGSPAQVDRPTALRVAHNEKEAHKALIHYQNQGMRPDKKITGVEGIVFSTTMIGDIMYVHDLITLQVFAVPLMDYRRDKWESRLDRQKYLSHATSRAF